MSNDYSNIQGQDVNDIQHVPSSGINRESMFTNYTFIRDMYDPMHILSIQEISKQLDVAKPSNLDGYDVNVDPRLLPLAYQQKLTQLSVPLSHYREVKQFRFQPNLFKLPHIDFCEDNPKS